MPSINLKNPADSADGILSDVRGKLDGSADENNILFIAKIRFPILTAEEAKSVDDLIPGAAEIWRRSANVQEGDTEKHHGSVKTPNLGAVQGSLTSAVGSNAGKIAIEGACDILAAELRSSRKETMLVVSVRWGGQTTSAADRLFQMLGKTVNFSFSSQQGVFAFPSSGSSGDPDDEGFEVNAGDIASTSDGFTGIVQEIKEIDGTESVILTNFGTEAVVALEDIVGAVEINFTPANMKSYEKKAAAAGHNPDWCHLLAAINETDDDKITKGVIDRAIEIGQEAQEASGLDAASGG